MHRADCRRAGLLVVAMAALAIPSLAQDRQRPSDVEVALIRRVEAWLRDRGQKGLACRTCDCVADRVQWCGDCERTGVDRRKARAALWRYMPPSFRRASDEDAWTMQVLQASRGRWQNLPLACPGLSVRSTILSRDVAMACVGLSDDTKTWETVCWVREGGALYVQPTLEPFELVVRHEWFVSGTFSARILRAEFERLRAAEADPTITDLERTRRQEARLAAEAATVGRVMADMGRLVNVRRDVVGAEARVWYFVRIRAVDAEVEVAVLPGVEGEKVLEDRLAALAVGTHVAFRGTIHSWTPMTESGYFETVRVVGEVAAGE